MGKNKDVRVIVWINVIFAILFIAFAFLLPLYRINEKTAYFDIQLLKIGKSFNFFKELFNVLKEDGSGIGLFFGIVFFIPFIINIYILIVSFMALINILKILVNIKNGENSKLLIPVGRITNMLGITLFVTFQFALLEKYTILPAVYVLLVCYIVVLVITNIFTFENININEIRKPLLKKLILNYAELVLMILITCFAKNIIFEINSFALSFTKYLSKWFIITVATIITMLFPLYLILNGIWHLNLSMLNDIISEETVKQFEKLKQEGTDVDGLVEPRKPIMNIILVIIMVLCLIALGKVVENGTIFFKEEDFLSEEKRLLISQIINIDEQVLDKVNYTVVSTDITATSVKATIALNVGWFGLDNEVFALIACLIVWAIISFIRNGCLSREKKNEIGVYLYKMFNK